jgi:hypothetical protein
MRLNEGLRIVLNTSFVDSIKHKILIGGKNCPSSNALRRLAHF